MKLPKVKDCVAYIESCGWEFQYYNRPWYVFRIKPREVESWAGTKSIDRSEFTFTLTELRDAKRNGW